MVGDSRGGKDADGVDGDLQRPRKDLVCIVDGRGHEEVRLERLPARRHVRLRQGGPEGAQGVHSERKELSGGPVVEGEVPIGGAEVWTGGGEEEGDREERQEREEGARG